MAQLDSKTLREALDGIENPPHEITPERWEIILQAAKVQLATMERADMRLQSVRESWRPYDATPR